ncbi:MAG: hypothetical protein ACFFD1_00145 [Candidatus Thorarchaeota archaeon]
MTDQEHIEGEHFPETNQEVDSGEENYVENTQEQDNESDLSQEQPQERKSSHQTFEEFVSNGGNPNEFMGKEAYDKFGRMIKEVKEIKQKLRLSEYAQETILNHYKTDQAEKIKNDYERIKNAREEAINYGDVDKVNEYDKELIENAQKYQQLKPEGQQQVQPLNPYLIDFIERHPEWFPKDVPPNLYPYIEKSNKKLEDFKTIGFSVEKQMMAEGKVVKDNLHELVDRIDQIMSAGNEQNINNQGNNRPVNPVNTPQHSSINKSIGSGAGGYTRSQLNEIDELQKQQDRLGLPRRSPEQLKEYIKKYNIK